MRRGFHPPQALCGLNLSGHTKLVKMWVQSEPTARSSRRCKIAFVLCWFLFSIVALGRAQLLANGVSSVTSETESKTPQVLSQRFEGSTEHLSSRVSHREGVPPLQYPLTSEFQSLKSRPSLSATDGLGNGAVCANGSTTLYF